MAHVITQPCCNDASCVTVCPVNCIHPTPGEPEFATAEMLYIDPGICIDCGACVDECPVSAIYPEDQLTIADERYVRINADYYLDHDRNAGVVPPRADPALPRGETLRVAIVGSGPAAFYTAEELLRHSQVSVDVIEKLPTPYGLVRAGVAPDHPGTKSVEANFDRIAAKRNFGYILGVEVGRDVSHEELMQRYGAVVYASGASTDRRLDIPGEDLAGSVAATEFVAWYNGHPDYASRNYDFSAERAVIIGNGNVALDVARILLSDPEVLAHTEIADYALAALRQSKIREVQVIARRGIADAAYTTGEFLAMGDLPGVDVVIDPDEMALDPASAQALAASTLDSTVATKLRIAKEFAARPLTGAARRLVLRYLLAPREVVGQGGAVSSIRLARNSFGDTDSAIVPTGEIVELATGMLVRAVGYRGQPIVDLPFDKERAVVPNEGGRVLDAPGGSPIPGIYVAGWIKRGPTGGIGMNRVCGQETARAVIEDFTNGVVKQPNPPRHDVAALARRRDVEPIDARGWTRIDEAERAAGRSTGRRRVKITTVARLRETARTSGLAHVRN